MPAIRTVQLSERDLKQLHKLLQAGTTEQRLVRRIRVLLAAADGLSNEEIAQRCECSIETARVWRNRWLEQGFDGLRDSPGRGRKRGITAEKEAAIVAATLSPPKIETHWSARRLAERLDVSKSTIHRVWKRHGLQPHRQETFKYSNDPLLTEKVIDIVGLYLNPPENAVVLAVDEKSQIQALDRTQPLLPMRTGQPECRTHDYRRHGTTTLFAALDVATGEVLGSCKKRHRHQEFLSFLRTLEKHFPEGEIHIVLDNYSPHKHPKVNAWLARRPRFSFHFTPTSASWMNQVGTWFSILTTQTIRRGTFTSVQTLIRKIYDFINHWNETRQPFQWVKTSDQILAKAIH